MANRVLIVDDQPAMASMLSTILRTDDHTTRSAHNGLRAIQIAKEWKPDIILLDVMMPDMDGFEVCRRLRQIESTAHTPIIMVTAKERIEDKIIGLESGADDYVTKPFNKDELRARVSTRLRRIHSAITEIPLRRTGMKYTIPLITKRERSGVFRKSYQVTKRLFDVLVCLAMLPVVLPLMALITLAVYIDSPGNPFFIQPRTGKNGDEFAMIKFRTMVPNAEKLKEKYRHLNELTWPDFKITNDPRRTQVGKFLRRTSLDEIPQVWNILKGEMSIVGPRPTSFDSKTYKLWQTERLEVIPGLTGLWQVGGRSNIDFDERVELDIEYIERQSWRLDVEIILQTVGAVLKGKGAY